jgi:uncharacterized membrane protein
MAITILLALALFLFYRSRKISKRLNGIEEKLATVEKELLQLKKEVAAKSLPPIEEEATIEAQKGFPAAARPVNMPSPTPLPPKPEIPQPSPLPTKPDVPPIVTPMPLPTANYGLMRSAKAEEPLARAADAPSPEPPATPQKIPTKPSAISDKLQQKTFLLDLEEMLGTDWLLKIGTALVVVGLALFLGYTLQHMGPYGKVLVAVGVSIAAIAGGWFAERRKGYGIFGRVLQSGGWALAYFTAYAMRYVEATRILSGDVAGFALMMLVAAGMIAHSLYYRSQFITGFAFGLGYLAMVINPVGWHTLLASLVLTVSIVIILWRLDWFGLEVYAVLGTYGIHLMWLYPIIKPMGAVKRVFPEFYGSIALLAIYWLVLVVSHFLRRGKNPKQEKFLQVSIILNSVALLACFAYQAVNPQLAFWGLIIFGFAHFILTYISNRLDRRESYLVTSTLGAVLVVAAVPFKFTTEVLPITWLVQCEAFLLIGYRLKEPHFRRLAMMASALLFSYLATEAAVSYLQHTDRLDIKNGIPLLITGLAFTFNMLVMSRIFRDQIKTADEKQVLDLYGYAGWLFLLSSPMLLLSWQWVIFAWLAIGVIYYEGYRHCGRIHLSNMSFFTMILAIGRAVIVHDAANITHHHGWNIDTLILFAVTAILYAFSGNSHRHPLDFETRDIRRQQKLTFDNYSYAAWLLLLVASWQALPWVWWGLALGAGVWALHLAGRIFGEERLLIQAQLTAAIAASRVIFVNLADASELFGIGQRMITGGAVACLLYGYSEMARRRPAFKDLLSTPVHLWVNAPAASLILIILIWYTLSGASVALGWAVLALVLMEIGRWQGRADLRWQGHVIAMAVLVRLLVANLNAEGQFGWASTRLVTVLPLVAMFYYLFSAMQKDAAAGMLTSKEMTSSALTHTYGTGGLIALLGVLYFELSPIWVAAAWAAVSVVVMAIGKIRDIHLFRTQAVILTWLVLARCAFENLYSTESWREWNARIVVLSLVTALLLLGFFISRFFRSKARTDGIQIEGLRRALQECDAKAHHFFFFAAVGVITALIWREATAGGYLTAAWAVEAFAVFVAALALNERPYRLFSMGLLLVCVAKVILLDVWQLQTLPRIIVFIVLGIILVLVSFFYTRYRDLWRKILLG